MSSGKLLRAAQRASSDAQSFPQEVSESFQRALKYLLKLTDHSFGHSKGFFGSRKGPFEAQGWGHGPMPPPLDPSLPADVNFIVRCHLISVFRCSLFALDGLAYLLDVSMFLVVLAKHV